MTQTDFLCLSPFLIIAIAPIAIMIVITILRNYEVVYSFSVLSLLLAFTSIFFYCTLSTTFYRTSFYNRYIQLVFSGYYYHFCIACNVCLSYDYIKQLEGAREEYYIILLTSTLGASLLAVANHFILFFLGLETLSISLYVLIAFQKSKDNSIEAGIKYLILASVSSAFLLFGMALIYTSFGTMQFSGILSALTGNSQLSTLVLTGFGMMMVGIGFKLALVPFHMWTPDVYQGAPAPIAAYIATVSKGAVMAILIRFFFNIRGFDNKTLFIIISAIAILSMFIGNLLAIRQKNIKRLLAYSSIANMGVSYYYIAYRYCQRHSGISFLSHIIFCYNNWCLWSYYTSFYLQIRNRKY